MPGTLHTYHTGLIFSSVEEALKYLLGSAPELLFSAYQERYNTYSVQATQVAWPRFTPTVLKHRCTFLQC